MKATNKSKKKLSDPTVQTFPKENSSQLSLETLITTSISNNREYLWKRIKHDMTVKILNIAQNEK